MKIQKLTLAALLAVSALFVSCDDSDDPIDAVWRLNMASTGGLIFAIELMFL